MAKKTVSQTVECYHCRQAFEAGKKAITIPCPRCHRVVTVGDVVVKTLKAVVKLQTCGRVVIEPKGRVTAELVEAHLGVDVAGSIEANVVSGGPVRIRAKARWKGDCRAPVLLVEPGGRIAGGYFVIPYVRA